jgi:hypothetical protein
VRREGLTVRALCGDEIKPGTGTPSSPSTWTPAGRKVGLALSDALLLRHPGRDAGRQGRAGDGRERRTAVGGALNLKGDDTLYGRYWGCLESHAFLHFEACYYQAIDYAIAHGLQRVEAGAQGDHKIQRGYLPVRTYSAHWIGDPGFRRAVDNFLKQERPAVEREIEALGQYSPFRKENE